MATRCPEAGDIALAQVSKPELERAYEKLTQEVAEQKRQLVVTFRNIHQIVAHREATLMAELDAIPAGIAARIAEHGASLDQLRKLKEEAERQLQANRLNAFLQQQLFTIQTEMDRIISDQILFPRVSTCCKLQDIQRTLEEKCLIQKRHNPYIIRTLPVWSGVAKGERENELNLPKAICIDPTSHLIYVTDHCETKLKVFTNEGKYHSILHNEKLKFSQAMKIYQEFLYLSTTSINLGRLPQILLKLNKKGETIKCVKPTSQIHGLFIETERIYTCTESLTLQLFDLNLKQTNRIPLKINFDDEFTPSDVRVNKQQIIVLFRNPNLPSQIIIFRQDGTLIRSLTTENDIKNAHYFCLDSYENILVSDYDGHCIRVFSQDGFLIHNIGGEEEGGLEALFRPEGITVDSKGRIIVLDGKELNKLQAF